MRPTGFVPSPLHRTTTRTHPITSLRVHNNARPTRRTKQSKDQKIDGVTWIDFNGDCPRWQRLASERPPPHNHLGGAVRRRWRLYWRGRLSSRRPHYARAARQISDPGPDLIVSRGVALLSIVPQSSYFTLSYRAVRKCTQADSRTREGASRGWVVCYTVNGYRYCDKINDIVLGRDFSERYSSVGEVTIIGSKTRLRVIPFGVTLTGSFLIPIDIFKLYYVDGGTTGITSFPPSLAVDFYYTLDDSSRLKIFLIKQRLVYVYNYSSLHYSWRHIGHSIDKINWLFWNDKRLVRSRRWKSFV